LTLPVLVNVFVSRGSKYHQFTVRTLHKYVIRAIRGAGKDTDGAATTNTEVLAARKASAAGLLDKLALGRALLGGSHGRSASIGSERLRAIEESEVLEPSPSKNNENNHAEREELKENNVTYRERLGGFLHPRDMRRLVTPFSASNEPEIIVRRHAILLNFDTLRAIILRDRLLVVVPDGADSILVELEKRLRGGFDNTDHDTSYSLDHFDTASNPDDSTPAPSMDPMIPKQTGDTESGADTDSTVDLQKDGSELEPLEFVDSAFLTEGEQDFFEALVENEWDELEGKAWIDLPFELQSVDAVLSCVTSMLADDVLELQFAANAVIVSMLEQGTNVDDHSQEVLRQMKNSVQEMTSRVDGFNRALDEILEDYEDMTLMNLSRLLTHPERFIQPVPQSVLDEESDEPELILEAHLQRGHTLNNGLRLIQGQITSTEEYAERKSDEIRNRLLYINLLLQTLSLSVAIGSFVGSIFGMNVLNQYEDSSSAFYVIICVTLTFMAGFGLFVIALIRRVGALPKL
jgi:magnesium transporter